MVATTASRSSEYVMQQLAAGVPLTLLIDLVDPRGPQSREIWEQEAGHAPEPPLITRASA